MGSGSFVDTNTLLNYIISGAEREQKKYNIYDVPYINIDEALSGY